MLGDFKKFKVRQERAEIRLRDVYSAAQAARQAWRTLAWQVPALALTAEAVLIAVIVAEGTSEYGRLIASVVAWVAVTMALQLFLRHGYLSDLSETWLAQIERDSKLPVVSDRKQIACEVRRRGGVVKVEPAPFAWLAQQRSRPIWAWTLVALSLADVLLSCDALTQIIWGESVLGGG